MKFSAGRDDGRIERTQASKRAGRPPPPSSSSTAAPRVAAVEVAPALRDRGQAVLERRGQDEVGVDHPGVEASERSRRPRPGWTASGHSDRGHRCVASSETLRR